MSDDLISRSEFIQYINANVMGGSDWAREIRQDFIDMVNSQPTAYNVDKVIYNLEARSIDNTKCALLKGNTEVKSVSLVCRADEDRVAIGIVKAGGKK